jgi:hypothetical protein
MAYFQDDDETVTTLHDRFGDVLRLLDAAANAKTVAAGVRQLRKVTADIATAKETLARLQRQAAGIVEAAKAEAARIVKDAEQQVAEDKGEREHHEQQLVYLRRLLGKLEGGPVLRQARELLAEEDDKDGRTVNFETFEAMDPDYGRADASGLVAVDMARGGTLMRSFPNKARREATR